MDALSQRLKELDRDKFEGLIFQLLRERYPGADIHRVDGAGGDEGVDTFLGDLAGGSTVWQAKSFSNGIRAPQRKKIMESLRRVLDAHHPACWVLCTSINLDIKGHKWFQELKAKYRGTVTIELWSASEIALEINIVKQFVTIILLTWAWMLRNCVRSSRRLVSIPMLSCGALR